MAITQYASTVTPFADSTEMNKTEKVIYDYADKKFTDENVDEAFWKFHEDKGAKANKGAQTLLVAHEHAGRVYGLSEHEDNDAVAIRQGIVTEAVQLAADHIRQSDGSKEAVLQAKQFIDNVANDFGSYAKSDDKEARQKFSKRLRSFSTSNQDYVFGFRDIYGELGEAGRFYQTKLDSGIKLTSDFGAFATLATQTALVGKVAGILSGQTDEMEAVREAVSSGTAGLSEGWQTAAKWTGMALMMGETALTGSLAGGMGALTMSHFMANSALGDIMYSSGLERKYFGKDGHFGSFMATRVVDALTYKATLGVTGQLAELAPTGIAGVFGQKAFESTLKNVYKASLLPVARMAGDVAFDTLVDYSFYNTAEKLLGIDMTSETHRQFSNMSKGAILQNMAMRGAMRVGHSITRWGISKKARIGAKTLKKFAAENYFKGEAKGMQQFGANLFAFTHSFMPSHLAEIHQSLRSKHTNYKTIQDIGRVDAEGKPILSASGFAGMYLAKEIYSNRIFASLIDEKTKSVSSKKVQNYLNDPSKFLGLPKLYKTIKDNIPSGAIKNATSLGARNMFKELVSMDADFRMGEMSKLFQHLLPTFSMDVSKLDGESKQQFLTSMVSEFGNVAKRAIEANTEGDKVNFETAVNDVNNFVSSFAKFTEINGLKKSNKDTPYGSVLLNVVKQAVKEADTNNNLNAKQRNTFADIFSKPFIDKDDIEYRKTSIEQDAEFLKWAEDFSSSLTDTYGERGLKAGIVLGNASGQKDLANMNADDIRNNLTKVKGEIQEKLAGFKRIADKQQLPDDLKSLLNAVDVDKYVASNREDKSWLSALLGKKRFSKDSNKVMGLVNAVKNIVPEIYTASAKSNPSLDKDRRLLVSVTKAGEKILETYVDDIVKTAKTNNKDFATDEEKTNHITSRLIDISYALEGFGRRLNRDFLAGLSKKLKQNRKQWEQYVKFDDVVKTPLFQTIASLNSKGQEMSQDEQKKLFSQMYSELKTIPFHLDSVRGKVLPILSTSNINKTASSTMHLLRSLVPDETSETYTDIKQSVNAFETGFNHQREIPLNFRSNGDERSDTQVKLTTDDKRELEEFNKEIYNLTDERKGSVGISNRDFMNRSIAAGVQKVYDIKYKEQELRNPSLPADMVAAEAKQATQEFLRNSLKFPDSGANGNNRIELIVNDRNVETIDFKGATLPNEDNFYKYADFIFRSKNKTMDGEIKKLEILNSGKEVRRKFAYRKNGESPIIYKDQDELKAELQKELNKNGLSLNTVVRVAGFHSKTADMDERISTVRSTLRNTADEFFDKLNDDQIDDFIYSAMANDVLLEDVRPSVEIAFSKAGFIYDDSSSDVLKKVDVGFSETDFDVVDISLPSNLNESNSARFVDELYDRGFHVIALTGNNSKLRAVHSMSNSKQQPTEYEIDHMLDVLGKAISSRQARTATNQGVSRYHLERGMTGSDFVTTLKNKAITAANSSDPNRKARVYREVLKEVTKQLETNLDRSIKTLETHLPAEVSEEAKTFVKEDFNATIEEAMLNVNDTIRKLLIKLNPDKASELKNAQNDDLLGYLHNDFDKVLEGLVGTTDPDTPRDTSTGNILHDILQAFKGLQHSSNDVVNKLLEQTNPETGEVKEGLLSQLIGVMRTSMDNMSNLRNNEGAQVSNALFRLDEILQSLASKFGIVNIVRQTGVSKAEMVDQAIRTMGSKLEHEAVTYSKNIWHKLANKVKKQKDRLKAQKETLKLNRRGNEPGSTEMHAHEKLEGAFWRYVLMGAKAFVSSDAEMSKYYSLSTSGYLSKREAEALFSESNFSTLPKVLIMDTATVNGLNIDDGAMYLPDQMFSRLQTAFGRDFSKISMNDSNTTLKNKVINSNALADKKIGENANGSEIRLSKAEAENTIVITTDNVKQLGLEFLDTIGFGTNAMKMNEQGSLVVGSFTSRDKFLSFVQRMGMHVNAHSGAKDLKVGVQGGLADKNMNRANIIMQGGNRRAVSKALEAYQSPEDYNSTSLADNTIANKVTRSEERIGTYADAAFTLRNIGDSNFVNLGGTDNEIQANFRHSALQGINSNVNIPQVGIAASRLLDMVSKTMEISGGDTELARTVRAYYENNNYDISEEDVKVFMNYLSDQDVLVKVNGVDDTPYYLINLTRPPVDTYGQDTMFLVRGIRNGNIHNGFEVSQVYYERIQGGDFDGDNLIWRAISKSALKGGYDLTDSHDDQALMYNLNKTYAQALHSKSLEGGLTFVGKTGEVETTKNVMETAKVTGSTISAVMKSMSFVRSLIGQAGTVSGNDSLNSSANFESTGQEAVRRVYSPNKQIVGDNNNRLTLFSSNNGKLDANTKVHGGLVPIRFQSIKTKKNGEDVTLGAYFAKAVNNGETENYLLIGTSDNSGYGYEVERVYQVNSDNFARESDLKNVLTRYELQQGSLLEGFRHSMRDANIVEISKDQNLRMGTAAGIIKQLYSTGVSNAKQKGNVRLLNIHQRGGRKSSSFIYEDLMAGLPKILIGKDVEIVKIDQAGIINNARTLHVDLESNPNLKTTLAKLSSQDVDAIVNKFVGGSSTSLSKEEYLNIVSPFMSNGEKDMHKAYYTLQKNRSKISDHVLREDYVLKTAVETLQALLDSDEAGFSNPLRSIMTDEALKAFAETNENPYLQQKLQASKLMSFNEPLFDKAKRLNSIIAKVEHVLPVLNSNEVFSGYTTLLRTHPSNLTGLGKANSEEDVLRVLADTASSRYKASMTSKEVNDVLAGLGIRVKEVKHKTDPKAVIKEVIAKQGYSDNVNELRTRVEATMQNMQQKNRKFSQYDLVDKDGKTLSLGEMFKKFTQQIDKNSLTGYERKALSAVFSSTLENMSSTAQNTARLYTEGLTASLAGKLKDGLDVYGKIEDVKVFTDALEQLDKNRFSQQIDFLQRGDSVVRRNQAPTYTNFCI